MQSGLGQLEWLSYRSGGHGALPNLFWVVPVPEGLADDAVLEVVNALVLRHEVLRTSFDADDDGRPRQCVHDNVVTALPRIEDEASRLDFETAPFDVASGPPIRFGRTANGDLIFSLSHIAADGMGSWVLVGDLTELLAAQGEQRAAHLGETVPQPIDRALHEREAGRSRVEAALRYWDTALRGFPVTVLPVSRGKPGADVVRAYLDSPAACVALAALKKKLGATPSSIFTAAVYTALAVQFSRERLGLSLTWSFREYPATRDLVAAIFRDMPLVVDLGGQPSFAEVVRRLQKSVLLAGRQMSFDVLEFHESAGRLEAERGAFLPGPEAISVTFDEFDLDSVRPGGDPVALLAESRLSFARTNHFTDVCNLYVSAEPVDGQLRIESRIDADAAGARDDAGIVRLIEAILVHASTSGDLTFAQAEALATDPWRPGERWARIDGVWVDLDFLTARIKEHPLVRHAEVREEDGQVTARVSAELEPWELRDFLLSTDNGRNAVLSPPHFVVQRDGGATVSGSGADRPVVEPDGPAGHALRDAVAKANDLAELTMAGTYLTVGGRLHLAPRVLSLLRDNGFEGIAVEDLRRPASLRALAGRLRPHR